MRFILELFGCSGAVLIIIYCNTAIQKHENNTWKMCKEKKGKEMVRVERSQHPWIFQQDWEVAIPLWWSTRGEGSTGNTKFQGLIIKCSGSVATARYLPWGREFYSGWCHTVDHRTPLGVFVCLWHLPSGDAVERPIMAHQRGWMWMSR